MGYSLREAALAFDGPVGHGASCGGEGCAFSEAEHHAGGEHGGEAASESGEESCYSPDDGGDGEGEAGTVAIADRSTNDLEDQIRVGEGGEDESDLGAGEMELVLEDGGSSADVNAIDVGDRVHEADEGEYGSGCEESTATHSGSIGP